MTTKKGRGWRGDKVAHQKAGSKGGNTTAKTQGREFYSRIGAKGGALSGGNFKHNIELAKKAGRRSGQKRRKEKYLENYSKV
ncbi:MAG TPA: general stress protein [Methylomirabilota bacterium]|nr:general stress protein [Methylomirabilota bacterium]